MSIIRKKNTKSFWAGFLFVFLFVAQQVISEVNEVYSLVNPYWVFITFIFIVVGISILPIKEKKYKEPLTYAVLSSLFGVFSAILTGYSPGYWLAFSIYLFVGLFGYVYIQKYRINLWAFDVLMIFMYVYFVLYYFGIVDLSTGVKEHNEADANTFVHSSSNAIAICLNGVLFFYSYLNYYYQANRKVPILIFSIINFYLIIIQQSRIGVAVSLMLVIISLYDFFSTNNKSKRRNTFNMLLTIILLIIGGMIIVSRHGSSIVDYTETVGINKYLDNTTEDSRYYLRSDFFGSMNLHSFLFGYPQGYIFAGFDNRTYNALLDYWNLYGFFAMILFVFMAIKRIRKRKDYGLSIIRYLPIFIYSMFESFLARGLWMTIVFMFLFLKDNEKIKETD